MSDARKWSAAQLRAIEERGKNLLVAAAAGSGKTSVLVERIIRRILQGETDVDRLLVVTFTNAAAAEMRERIEAALAQEIAKGTASPKLERQLALLSNASISTLHAFCQNVIRRNFSVIDLDPKFRLANEQERRLLQQDALEEVFEKKYDEAQEDFLSFAAAYGTEHGDEALYAMVLRLYAFSCSQPFPSRWLDSLAESFDLAEQQRLLDTPWAQSVLAQISFELAAGLAAIERLVEKAAALGYETCHAALEGDEKILKDLLDALAARDWEGLRQAFSSYAHARMSFPKGMDEEEKEEAKRLFTQPRDRVKQRIKKLRDTYFHATEEELLDDLRALSGMAHAIVDVVKDFTASFQAAKKERGVVDFNDLEHFALAVLCDKDAPEGELRPSAQALALREKYEEVMVDEYQDTNGVQEAILSLVARDDNLFAVGDVKQSIYRFRLADPQLFLKKQREYPTLGEKYARIDLSENYRSRAGVLAAVNWIFSQLMTPEAMELAYDDAAALHFAALYPEDSPKSLAGAAELHIIESDAESSVEPEEEDEEKAETSAVADGGAETPDGEEEEELKGFALEAAFIARRVHELMESGALVADKDGYRPLRWRDIVILLRAVRTKADILLETLRDADIPAYATLDAGYFQATEVRVVLAVLAVIDNARQDVPLAAALCSPIVGLSVSELAELRLAAPEEDIFGALLVVNDPAAKFSASLREKVDAFLRLLKGWRDLVRRVSVPELIWQIYRDTGYYDYVGGMAGGLLRQANLRMLADRARDYEETNFRGLFRFLRFIEKMQQMETDLSAARTLGEGEDVVRIMTIHKSKGLEFPVVIVAGLGSKFNMQDASQDLLMHRELGLGLYRTEREKSLRYSTFAREAVAERIKRESKAEELRVLYVAMTRAREKLILVGSTKKLAACAEGWCSFVTQTERALPAHAALAANSFLDWLGMTVARHADGAPLREKAALLEKRVAPEGKDDSRWQVEIVPASAVASVSAAVAEDDELFEKLRRGEPLEASEEKDDVEQMLAWQYAPHGVDNVPAKLSVTELKRRFSVEDAAEEKAYIPLKEVHGSSKNVFKRPDFMQEKTGLSAAEYGTLMHAVLQHIDLAGDTGREGLEKQLAKMVEQELLLPEQAKAVRLDAVASFLQSPLGTRMKKARRLWRELPFSRRLEAHRFYPEAESEARIFVQGVIDVLFEDEAGALVLLDYKTDKNTRPAAVREKYRLQIEIYTEAVEAILGRKVAERCLYLLQDGSVVQL